MAEGSLSSEGDGEDFVAMIGGGSSRDRTVKISSAKQCNSVDAKIEGRPT
jgi:hypothetical protein